MLTDGATYSSWFATMSRDGRPSVWREDRRGPMAVLVDDRRRIRLLRP